MDNQFRIDKHRLEFLMEQKGIRTLQQLAEISGVHGNTLTRILRGEKWTSDTATKLADALDCNPIDLLVAKGYPDPKLAAPVALSQN